MDLTGWEAAVRGLGGVLTAAVLAAIYYGIWRGIARPAGQSVGRFPRLLSSPGFYAAASAVFLGACWGLWRPLPITLEPAARTAALAAGSLLFFPGLGLALWGRLTLGPMYFVSTGLGARLFADHQLVMRGPYQWVRHPMYTGLAAAVLGGLLLYQTWTLVVLLLLPAALRRRARQEELALAARFGEAWRAYCRRVPAWFPRLRRGPV